MSASVAIRGRGVATSKGRSVAERRLPFAKVMRDLLIEREITTGMGNPNWMAFVNDLAGVHYETLRKAISGERSPNVALMEECASALGVDPMLFLEYEAAQAMRQF